jgi:hypothetical protein
MPLNFVVPDGRIIMNDEYEGMQKERFFVGYFTAVSVAKVHDRYIMNWNGFGRKRS